MLTFCSSVSGGSVDVCFNMLTFCSSVSGGSCDPTTLAWRLWVTCLPSVVRSVVDRLTSVVTCSPSVVRSAVDRVTLPLWHWRLWVTCLISVVRSAVDRVTLPLWACWRLWVTCLPSVVRSVVDRVTLPLWATLSTLTSVGNMLTFCSSVSGGSCDPTTLSTLALTSVGRGNSRCTACDLSFSSCSRCCCISSSLASSTSAWSAAISTSPDSALSVNSSSGTTIS